MSKDDSLATIVPGTSTERPTTFTAAQEAKLDSAILAADTAVRDTLFGRILLELDRNGVIEWGENRLYWIPKAARDTAGRFLLAEFARRGNFNRSEMQAWDLGSSATADERTCGGNFRVNVNRLDRTLALVAGTLVHERVHTFCQQHRTNVMNDNICDFAYVAGDLAAALIRFRGNGSRRVPQGTHVECTALRVHLRDAGIYIRPTGSNN